MNAIKLTERPQGEVFLNRIATAVPPHNIHSTFVEFALKSLPQSERGTFRHMVERSQVERRYSPLEPAGPGSNEGPAKNGFYRPGMFPSTAERMAMFADVAPKLAAEALDGLSGQRSFSSVTHLIVVTCTGYSAPGIDQVIMRRFGLPASVERITLGFMGCAASLNGLKLARHIVRSQPHAKVLIVSVELCTLHLQDSDDLEHLLCFLIFGDGCAAALVSAEPLGLALESFSSVILPAAERLMRWTIGNRGFDMCQSGRIPAAIGAALRREDQPELARTLSKVDIWAVHPAGRAVLDAVGSALALPEEALARSRSVLRDFGNMSSATIFFVLARLMEEPAESAGTGCALAFAPGLAVEAMRFRRDC